jgi:pyruvate,water dikinase
LKRVLFVKEILEAHGFRTDVTKDALRARIEQHDTETMVAKLKMLGYLSIHTRQLDMIMTNPAMVNRYRAQIMAQIESLLGKSPASAG